jgi:hypothetical protein
VSDDPVRGAIDQRVGTHQATQNWPGSVGYRHRVHGAILEQPVELSGIAGIAV